MWLGKFSSLRSSQVLLELAPYLSLVEILGVLTSEHPLCALADAVSMRAEFLLCLLMSPQ